jgi:hypothetical protein
MVKLRILRAMLLGDTSYPPGVEVEVLEDRAVELVARGHAAFLDPPSRQIEGRVAARKAELLVEAGPPARPAGALAALRAAFGRGTG